MILRLTYLLMLLVLAGCNRGVSTVNDQVPAQLAETRPVDNATNRPIQKSHDGYIGSDACLECHEAEHKTWHQSYHRKMTQLVSTNSVIGGFDGKTRDYYGWKFRPEQRGDEYWMRFNATSGEKEFEYKLVLSTGSHHMQKFWYQAGSSRKLGLAPLIYLRESGQWVPEHTAFLRPTEPALPVREGTWNKGCSRCPTSSQRTG